MNYNAAKSTVPATSGMEGLQKILREVRRRSDALASNLSPEDQVVQPMLDASPTKWHLGHTTWFFETFVLIPHLAGYKPYDARFAFCFNSYYEHEGKRQPRAKRGLMTRPSSAEVQAYRAHVDAGLESLFAQGEVAANVAELITLGLNHEQQHQELLLMDILNVFWSSPLRPAYSEPAANVPAHEVAPLTWTSFSGGTHSIGHAGGGFAFDNEGPQHTALIHPFRLANRLVTNGEWLQFMAAGGYTDFRHWLADGWGKVQAEGWDAPYYWEKVNGTWHQMTLEGLVPVNPALPICNISYYEADAFARWAGYRLPTEFEWEVAAQSQPPGENLLAKTALQPQPAQGQGLTQMFGHVWQWTQSSYAPYPGFKAAPGAVGEYNGKFMVSQYVLRGGACITPEGHSRKTYRNFFYPHQRWQFAGLRLAEDA